MKLMSPLPTYGFCMIVSASLVVLLSMSTDFFVAYVNDILAPCQHDSVYRDGECICNNPVFSGKYCEECQCKHFGICSITENSTSRWGCRCPSHQKWVGTLCDQCYSKHQTEEVCRGDCVEVEGVYKHYGPKCNTVCMPYASKSSKHCRDVTAGGGTCNACNEHGTCTLTGQCKCDEGYFTSRGGEQCAVTCDNCPSDRGRCLSIGGQLICACEEGWYGPNCRQSCIRPEGNGLPCSGHGTCGYNGQNELKCTCATHWIGDYCEQKCPGNETFPSSCSGHGQCTSSPEGAICDCVAPWEGVDCSCSATYTCSGHGACSDDATCDCFDTLAGSLEAHFTGKFCERCKEHWYGTGCHLRCEDSIKYTASPDTLGRNIGCNGHGSCQLELGTSSESVTCVCDGTDPGTFCATCIADYYPFMNILNVSVPHCSVACERGTCSQHGECNPNYDGTNHLCRCDVYSVPGTNITLDTIDAAQNCATCRKNWYPTAMDTSERCTKYCAAAGEIKSDTNQIQFLTGNSLSNDLQGDKDAQSICVSDHGVYKTDADCRVCSGQGTCFADGTCKCSEKTTGDYCNIQCGGANEAACSDHGRCVRNDLELWFNPYTSNYRCECLPYDTYTSETRQRLIKQGFQVEPPPSPNYYGQFCEFHCPRYNEDICAGRGDCKTGVVTDDEGYIVKCTSDAHCEHLSGAFCARLTSPWDSLMTNGKSFFSSGPNSPGYYSCATSTNCIDSIYSIKWDEFCVNMLHGWYPPVLNTAECAYTGNCRNHIETFFMEPYKDNKTWCEAAMGELSAPLYGTCGATSYANEVAFLTETVPVCLEYTLASTCNAQKQCIYDQTLNHIQSVDNECSHMSLPCTGPCQKTGNNTCETKTYCRAKTCQDIILENPIEHLCNVDAACSADVDWANFCAGAVGDIYKVSSELNSMETFYNCHMYRQRYNPQVVEKTTEIPLQGVLNIFGEDVTIASLRASFVDTLVNAGNECQQMDFRTGDFCTKHLERLVPFGYSAETPKDGWFLPWIVECPEGPDSVWPSESEAYRRISQVSLECKSHKRNSGVEGPNEWENNPSHADTNIYTELKKWSLDCPGQTVVTMDSVEYSYDRTNDNALTCHTDNGWVECSEVNQKEVNAWSPWPLNPRGCRLTENKLAQRWGSSGWSPVDVQREFTASCLEGLAAPWMPLSKPLPTLCDLGACHPEDECVLCSDPMATCDVSASVQCIARQSFFYRDDNRCQKNGTIWYPFPTRSRTYFCNWQAVATQNVTIDGEEFHGELNSRGILTVFGGSSMNKNASVTMDNVTKTIESFRTHQDKFSMVWSKSTELTEAAAETYISTLQNCNSDFNWFKFCAGSGTGTLLDLNPGFGLKSGWSGRAVLLREGILSLTKATFQGSQTNLTVTSQDRIRITCGDVTKEGTGQLSMPGPFQECQLLAVYPPAIVSSVLVSDVEQLQSFRDSLEGHVTRQFNLARDHYSEWAFAGDNTVYKHSFDLDSRNKGVRFDLEGQHENLRLTGWFKTSDDTGEIMSMRLSTEEDTEIITLYVYGHALYYKNGDKTESNGEKICNVPAKEWTYWTIQVDHLSDTDKKASAHKDFSDDASYYAQEWQLHVSVETSTQSENWSGIKSTESSVRLRRHHMKSADSFHDIANQSSQECAHHCLHHDDCQQWSWTHEDRHCYLHLQRCHEDSSCMHGRHLMNSHQSHKVSHFELFSARAREGNPLPTYWKDIRAEPIIESPTCEVINTSLIHPRWRAPFEALYEPFQPDATKTCNDLVDAWTLMPDYVSKVCYGNDCNYNPTDLKACGDHLDTLYPSNVPEECDSIKFLKTNWSAYCHYLTSFEGVKTDVGTEKRIPFLGGLALNWNDTCQEAWSVYDNGTATCPSVDFTWFRNCFERSSEYEEFCSSDCLDTIDEMLSSGNSEGICSIRQKYLNIATDDSGNANDIGQHCNCNLDNVIISDFCLMQNAYHDGESIRVPELYNSECSYGCRETLKDSFNRSEWRQWCLNLSDNKIPGTCSKTVCECNQQENVGVAGGRCELSCPSGISNGEELACSGRNGRCFAVDPSEEIPDTVKQQSAKETRYGTNFTGPLVPEWVSGPSPTMTGRCQCSLGSGDACSIPCERCNNGTYGYHMASQYGICDSFNGICRALPSFMRYNTKYVQPDIEVSYNTTAFESMLGVYRWEYPDRFLFEEDNTLLLQALRESHGIQPLTKSVDTSDLILNENIETVLQVFEDYCWSNQTDEPYLNNPTGVQFMGKSIEVNQTIVLKQIDKPKWGQCTKIQVSSSWYFCFAKGVLNAYDNSTSNPLLVRHTGISSIPKAKMSFVQRDDTTVYAYGGEYPYPKTTETFDDMYKITFYRRNWSPYDIVFTHWQLVRPTGDMRPPPATFAPMVSFYDELYLLTTLNKKHTLYRFKYETVTQQAEWFKLTPFTYQHKVVNIVGNVNRQISVYFDNSKVKTLSNESIWSRGAFVEAQDAVDALVSGYSSGQKMACTLEMHPNELRVGGVVIASYAIPGLKAFVFLEEWLTIDILSEANIRLRLQNAIQWHTKTEDSLDALIGTSTLSQALTSLDAVTRIHMHQARWYAYRDILVRYELSNRINRLSNRIDRQMVHYVSAPKPPDALLDFFSSVQPVFFESVPLTNPGRFSVNWEGETFERCLVIFGNFENGVYEQDVDFQTDRLQVRVSWTSHSFQIRLKNSESHIQWYKTGNFKAFAMVLHLEEWIYNKREPFEAKYTTANATDGQALFQLFLSEEAIPTYNMQSQMASFLQYTPSHCALTGDVECPGLMPFTNLPCSGRGRCSFSCQCTCEVAKSILASSETALLSVQWTDSPWRGNGCEITCPGYDGYLKDSICSNNGQCQRDGKCTCYQGYTGDACQFKCPVNEKNETCSLHGGCGTQAYDINSFQFVNDAYLDTLAAKNLEHYTDALLEYYRPCDLENFIQQQSAFGTSVKNQYPATFTQQAAKQLCSDMAVGRCVGVRQEQEAVIDAGNQLNFFEMMYVPVVLRDVLAEYTAMDNMEQFDCQNADCSVEVSEDDDSTLTGITFQLVSPEFKFFLRYVHGNSQGQQTFKVNGESFAIELDWTPEHCVVRMGPSVVVNVSYAVERIIFNIEDNVFTKKIYPSYIPRVAANETIWIAPDYTQKYRVQLKQLDGKYYNVPSSIADEVRPLLTRLDAEKECDAEVACRGILRWHSMKDETLYSLYTEELSIEGYQLNAIPALKYDFLNKMSLIYQGKLTSGGLCSVVKPGLAKYPSVSFTEEYNIPIQNADVSLAKDEDTGAVNVGDGIWTRCWTRKPNITTKVGCYNEANTHNYGFAFSDQTNLCLVYTGITDPNKIRLDKYNSETRLTKNNPCEQQSQTTWFT